MKRIPNTKVLNSLKNMPDFLIKAGWFEQSKYSDGTPIAGIAAVQNYGAVINQTVTEKQRNFLHYLGFHLKKSTNGLTIVIPPTHFMENCENNNKAKWKNAIKNIWTMVTLGNLSPDSAIEQIAMLVEGDLADEIANGSYPPDKPSTVKAKLNRYKNKKAQGNLDKRLVDTGLMLNSLSHQVEKL